MFTEKEVSLFSILNNLLANNQLELKKLTGEVKEPFLKKYPTSIINIKSFYPKEDFTKVLDQSIYKPIYNQSVKLPVFNPKKPAADIPVEVSMRVSEQQKIAGQALTIASLKGTLDEEYQKHKKALIKTALEDQFPRVKQEAAIQLRLLANSGLDGEIVRHMAALTRRIIRQKGQIAKLSTEQALAIRTICSLNDYDAQRVAIQLVTSEALDPRIKKLVLRKLCQTSFFNKYYGISDFISQYTSQDSREIPWDKFRPLISLYAHPSRELRETAFASISPVMSRGGYWLSDAIADYRDKTPNIPDRAFLQVLALSENSKIPIEKFDALFSLADKNRAVSEELTMLLTYLLEKDSCYDNGHYERGRILRALLQDDPNPDFLSVFISCLKKSLFMLRQARLDYLECSKFISCLYDPSGSAYKRSHSLAAACAAKPPSLQVIDKALEKQIVKKIRQILPKGSDVKKIAQLHSSWDGMEPFLIYISRLYDHQSDLYKDVLALMGEIIAHIDPPSFEEWKKWRYDLNNQKVNEQVGFLSSETLDAWISDYVVDLSDIQSEDVSEKIIKIREIFDQFADSGLKETGSVDIRQIEDKLRILTKFISLKDDLELAKRAAKSIGELNATECRKRRALKKAGFSTLKTTGQIHSEIGKIREGLGAENEVKIKNLAVAGIIKKYTQAKSHLEYLRSKNIQPTGEDLTHVSLLQNQLIGTLGNGFESLLKDYQNIAVLTANLPKIIDPKLADFLSRYGLKKSSPSEKLEAVINFIQNGIIELTHTEPMLDSDERRIYKTIKDLKIQKEILSLLTAKPATLSNKQLKEKLAVLVKGLGEYKDLSTKLAVLQEDAGKEHSGKNNGLVFIFTDHPLVALTVGKYPAGAVSCQSYWNGSDSLAAYPADAMTKLCLLVDKNSLPEDVAEKLDNATTNEEKLAVFNSNTYAFLDAMVARRVIKIVRNDQNQEPYIFLEPVYTSYNQTLMINYLNKFALGFLHPATGLPLVRGGGNMRVRVATSRNRSQYEDGEKGGPNNCGMGSQTDEYTMPAQFLAA